MDDTTPDTQPPVNGLTDNSFMPDASMQPAPSNTNPATNGGQVLRAAPRPGLSMDGTVAPGRRPMSRPMINSRPMRRPNQNSGSYLNPVSSRPLDSSGNNPVQATAPAPQQIPVSPQPPLAPQPSPRYVRPLVTRPVPQARRPIPQQPTPQQQYPNPQFQKQADFQPPPQYWPPVASRPVRQTPKVSPSKATQFKSKVLTKNTLSLSLKGAVAVIVLVSATQLFSWFSAHYFSVYNKLVPAHYSNQKGLDFSLIHPKALSYNGTVAGQLKLTPVAYSYNLSSQREALIDVNYSPIGKALQTLKLTPAELLAQVKAGSGTYINYLNETSPGATAAYKNCNNTVVTTNGSDLMCTVNGTNGTITHVIDANSSYLYSLNLYIPKSIWGVHQNIWQKVEKSFSIQ